MTRLSIIIPAHQEADWIGQTLESLLLQRFDGDVDAIVVANGCTDDTAARARESQPDFAARGWRLTVADLPQGGKPGALNHGDGIAHHGARIYLDADVRLGPGMLTALAEALACDRAVYASGRLVVAPARSATTRAYARFWSRLPFVADGVPGAGLFAVNAAGRARWARFPDIIADDAFVRLQFAPDERVRVDAAYFWPAAEGLRRLATVRRRQDAGVAEIARLYPALAARPSDRPMPGHMARLAVRDPIGFAVYAAVRLAARFRRGPQKWTRGR